MDDQTPDAISAAFREMEQADPEPMGYHKGVNYPKHCSKCGCRYHAPSCPWLRRKQARERAEQKVREIDVFRFETLVREERQRQDEQWGGPKHDDIHTPAEWERFLFDHVRRLTAGGTLHPGDENNDGWVEPIITATDYEDRLVKIAALCRAAFESRQRLAALKGAHTK